MQTKLHHFFYSEDNTILALDSDGSPARGYFEVRKMRDGHQISLPVLLG